MALFDMLEYYESATHLNISSNHNISVRGWQACARMIKKVRIYSSSGKISQIEIFSQCLAAPHYFAATLYATFDVRERVLVSCIAQWPYFRSTDNKYHEKNWSTTHDPRILHNFRFSSIGVE